ncbi:unnamed protein product [Rotaria sp. Silwood2]|nr:unnamed protein product [Rotaria sp. Silwood2]CAF3888670.1 unnamed protein product [Rotaria sp. Silwood2]
MINSIDVKMTPTTSINGNNKSTSTYHTLCTWSEIAHYRGLIYTITQMANNHVVLMIEPSTVRLKFFLDELDKRNYWLNRFYQTKKYFPMIDLDLNEENFNYQ